MSFPNFQDYSKDSQLNAFTTSLHLKEELHWKGRKREKGAPISQVVSQVYKDADTANEIAKIMSQKLGFHSNSHVITTVPSSKGGTRVIIASIPCFYEALESFNKNLEKSEKLKQMMISEQKKSAEDSAKDIEEVLDALFMEPVIGSVTLITDALQKRFPILKPYTTVSVQPLEGERPYLLEVVDDYRRSGEPTGPKRMEINDKDMKFIVHTIKKITNSYLDAGILLHVKIQNRRNKLRTTAL